MDGWIHKSNALIIPTKKEPKYILHFKVHTCTVNMISPQCQNCTTLTYSAFLKQKSLSIYKGENVLWVKFEPRWAVVFWESQDCQAYDWLTICSGSEPVAALLVLQRGCDAIHKNSPARPILKLPWVIESILFYCWLNLLLQEVVDALMTLSHHKPQQLQLDRFSKLSKKSFVQLIGSIQEMNYQSGIFCSS